MKLERLNPHLGAKVAGADITQFTLTDRDELLALLDEHLVLFFTGQNVGPRELLNFAEVIGGPPASASPGRCLSCIMLSAVLETPPARGGGCWAASPAGPQDQGA